MINFRLIFISLFWMILVATSNSFSQGVGNHLTMSLDSCIQISSNTIQFGLYAVSDGDSSSDIRANSFQYGINFDTLILQPGATITPSYVNGSSDFIPPLNPFNFPPSSTKNHIRISEQAHFAYTDSAKMIFGHPHRVGTFQLTSSVDWAANSCPSFSLQASTSAGKTVCAAVVWIGTSLITTAISATGTGNNQRNISANCSISLNCNLTAVVSSTPASCLGGSDGTATAIDSIGAAPLQYIWSNGQTSKIATGLVAGSYSVTITGISNCSCTSSTSVLITEPSSDLIVSTDHDTTICKGASAVISSMVTGGVAPYLYSWSGPNGFSSLNSNIAIVSATISDSGNYLLTVTDSAGCIRTSHTNLSLFFADTAVTLTGDSLTANATNSSYQWIDCSNNLPIAGATNQAYSPPHDGYFQAQVTDNITGCTDTSSCYLVVIAGISQHEINNNSIIIHPNPNSGSFFIYLNSAQKKLLSIKISDSTCRIVFDQRIDMKFPTELNLNGIAKGIYFISVNDGNNIYSRKLVIQ